MVKQRLNDQFIQNWNARLNNSSRALMYKRISNFRFQPYLDCFNINKFCQSFTRLRVSSHRLLIEAGRWVRPNNIPLDDRKCMICNKLEDEFHFIIECSIYTDLRKQYIPRKYWIRPNMLKFIELMNSENKKIVQNLGIFTFNAFKLRQSTV